MTIAYLRLMAAVIDVGELEENEPENRGVPYSDALRSELARRLSAAGQRSSSSRLGWLRFMGGRWSGLQWVSEGVRSVLPMN